MSTDATHADRGNARAAARRVPRWVRLISGLVVAAALLAAAEGLLRLLLGPPPPPVAVYTRADVNGQYLQQRDDGMVLLPYQTSSPTAPFPARSTLRRIAVLGGSSVHIGSGVIPTNREFAAIAGREAGVQTVNLGSPGLDSFDLVEIVEELGAVDFAATVVYTGHNDLGNASYQGRFGGRFGAAQAHALAALEHLQLFCQLRLLFARPEGQQVADASLGVQQDQRPLAPPRRQAALRYFEANLHRMAWISRQQGRPLVLVVPVCDLTEAPPPVPCPASLTCPTPLWEQGMAQVGKDPEEAARLLRAARDADLLASRAPTEVEEIIRGMAAEPGVIVVDPWEGLPPHEGAAIPSAALFSDGIHFSRYGHIELGKLLAPTLEGLGE